MPNYDRIKIASTTVISKRKELAKLAKKLVQKAFKLRDKTASYIMLINLWQKNWRKSNRSRQEILSWKKKCIIFKKTYHLKLLFFKFPLHFQKAMVYPNRGHFYPYANKLYSTPTPLSFFDLFHICNLLQYNTFLFYQ